MADMGVSATDSESPKTQARMRSYVGEERKISWSSLDRIRRVGCLKDAGASGGAGRAGVSGRGVGFSGAARRRRGSSLGSLSLRLETPLAGGGIAGSVAMQGVVAVVDDEGDGSDGGRVSMCVDG